MLARCAFRCWWRRSMHWLSLLKWSQRSWKGRWQSGRRRLLQPCKWLMIKGTSCAQNPPRGIKRLIFFSFKWFSYYCICTIIYVNCWMFDNPSRAATKSYWRFLEGWMKRKGNKIFHYFFHVNIETMGKKKMNSFSYDLWILLCRSCNCILAPVWLTWIMWSET